MRSIKELLEIVLNYGMGPFGICSVLYDIYVDDIITWDEYLVVERYIKDNKPVTVFYDWQGNVVSNSDQFWYKPGNANPRIKWLKKHIELNSKNNENN